MLKHAFLYLDTVSTTSLHLHPLRLLLSPPRVPLFTSVLYYQL